MARDIAYRWHKMNSAREAVFVKEGQTGDSANAWEKEVRTSLNSNNVECWTSGTSEDICSRSFKKEEKKLCSEAAKGQLQPHRPTCFSSAHQDYNIWLHNIANTHADKSPYATMQTIPPKGLFSLRDVQRGAAKKTGSATVASSRRIPACIISYLGSTLRTENWFPFLSPCCACQDRMSPLQLLLSNPWA